MSKNTISIQISQSRIKAGLTQKKLADKIGSYSANISEMESGKVSPNITTLQKIADVLNVTFVIQPQKK